MAEKRPICPINWGRCEGKVCAWWCEFAECCAVPLVAGILAADSSICQNVWNPPMEQKDGDGDD